MLNYDPPAEVQRGLPALTPDTIEYFGHHKQSHT